MTDKEKIRAEIEKLMKRYDSEYDLDETEVKAAKGNVCHEILCFIDSLPKESVSEDLEEAAEKYAYELFPSVGVANTETELAFKAGAQWQKEQMMKHCLEGRVVDDGGDFKLIVPSLHTILRNLDENDKVKVIIIKE